MLYLCATPIGNLEDITLRVLHALRAADAVWAEDTRITLKLLNRYKIKKPLLSCHEYNEKARADMLIEALHAGKTIAYCSDAGMPGISDPGAKLIHACIENNLPFTVLPGACAAINAVVLSGLSTGSFTFFGFLPRDKKPRRDMLNKMQHCPHTVILYESPMRIPSTLRELSALLGENRKAALARELTKLHEETVRGTLASLSAKYCDPPRGECVLIIEGKRPEENETVSEQKIDKALEMLIDNGLSKSDASIAVSLLYAVPKKQVYKRTLTLPSDPTL